MGAAGRDFHNFNQVFRDDRTTRVVAFTTTQIPLTTARRYPSILAGEQYPEGIPIEDESLLETLCREYHVQQVIFAYSDVPHAHVMHQAARVQSLGADFVLLGPERTSLKSTLPVIAVSAVRTGCGKSPVARCISRQLKNRHLRCAVLRHPMPYGDLERQIVQRFEREADLDTQHCTIEEREEYAPHIAAGNIVYAGIDYAHILQRAEQESDLILWEGGNNDFPFIQPDLHIVLADALRPGDELTYYPGESVLRTADVAIIAKANAAPEAHIETVRNNIRTCCPNIPIVLGHSTVSVEHPERIRGQRILVIEDGPSVTHGGLPHGAGYAAAMAAGAADIVDPRPFAAPSIRQIYAQYPHIGPVLPAIGYDKQQCRDLAETIQRSDVDVIVSATPVDLTKTVGLSKPVARVRYEYEDASRPGLRQILDDFLSNRLKVNH